MDIDEFLDTETGDHNEVNTDEINIDEKYEGAASESPDRIENSTFIPSEKGLSDKKLNSVNDDEVVDIENSAGGDAEDVKEIISTKSTFKDKFVSLVSSVQFNISKNDLVKSMQNLKELIMLSREIPSQKIDVRHKSDTTILALNNKILSKAQELRTDFDSHAKLINKLLVKVQVELRTSNVQKVVLLYQQIMSVYNELSDNFSEEKLALNDKILRLQSAMNELKIKTSDYNFESRRKKIILAMTEMDSLISQGNMEGADKKYFQIEDLFWELPDDHYEVKLKLNAEILKKKNAIDLSMQIDSLQSELRTHNPIVAKKELPELKKTPSSSSSFSSSSSLSSEFFGSNDVPIKIKTEIKSPPETITQKQTVTSASPVKKVEAQKPANRPAPIVPPAPESVRESREDSSIDEALKKISIAKVKIELVEGNYDNANILISQLLAKYPRDSEVMSLKSQITGKTNQPSVYAQRAQVVENKLGSIESELRSGNAEQALVDTESVEQSSAYQEVMSKAGVNLEKSAKNIAEAIVHKRINAAKEFISAKNNVEAKRNLERALKIDPKNKEALTLMRGLN